MHDDVAGAACVWEHRVCLNNFFGEPVIEPLEQERAQSGARSAGNRVQEHETLETVATICLTVNHLHNLFMHSLTRLIAVTPVVAGSDAVLADVKVLGIVNILVRPCLDTVDYAWLQVDQYGSGNVSCVVALVVENVFAIAALSRKLLEVPILANAVFLTQLLPKLATNYKRVSFVFSLD